jgi:hypothetical protein
MGSNPSCSESLQLFFDLPVCVPLGHNPHILQTNLGSPWMYSHFGKVTVESQSDCTSSTNLASFVGWADYVPEGYQKLENKENEEARKRYLVIEPRVPYRGFQLN